jgi:hypothetical protein
VLVGGPEAGACHPTAPDEELGFGVPQRRRGGSPFRYCAAITRQSAPARSYAGTTAMMPYIRRITPDA